MINIAYARKYRPNVMSEYIGERVKRTVLNRMKDVNTYPQVVLITGTTGCGKTTMARLMAKEYHCEDKVEGKACGKCYMCEMIEEEYIKQGKEIEGIQELDIASDSGKGKMDEFLDDAMQKPMHPLKYKVLILDECHMASRGSQNRLLKICEEPPKHLIFLLCTTDPENLIPTLKNRCQLTLEVTKPTVEELSDRLLEVCKAEGITTSIDALKMIARSSSRIPRESLNMLEEIAIGNGNKVTMDMIADHVSDVADDIYMEFYRSANKSIGAILEFNQLLRENDINSSKFIGGLARFTLDCLYIRNGVGLGDYPPKFIKSVRDLFKVYTEDEIDMLLMIIEHAIKLGVDGDVAELVVTTTAIRVGKIKILSKSLQREREQAEVENTESFKKYRDDKRVKDKESAEVRKVNMDDNVMAEVFGKQLVDIGEGNNSGSVYLDIADEDDGEIASDEDIIAKLLGN